MKLFAELFLDEDVSRLLAKRLESRGLRIHVTEKKRKASSDAEQLAWATEHGWVIVSHNRPHYEALDKAWCKEGRRHAGIILAPQKDPSELTDRIVEFLNQYTADELEGLVWYV